VEEDDGPLLGPTGSADRVNNLSRRGSYATLKKRVGKTFGARNKRVKHGHRPSRRGYVFCFLLLGTPRNEKS